MNVPTTESDEDLLRRARAGDESAFASLYDRRQAGVYRFALRMSGSEALAEDVTQDVFIALITESAGFDPSRGPVAAYLFGMARYRVLRHLQRDRAFVVVDASDDATDDDGSWGSPSGVDPLAELVRSRTIDSVRQAILALPVTYREVAVLCFLQETSYADAAIALGCAIGTVRSRLHRARELLAARLGAIAPVDRAAVTTARGMLG